MLLQFLEYFFDYKQLVLNIFCDIWSTQALVFADAKAIKENSVKLGAGEDLHALFAGVLTMRPWKRVIDPSPDHLVLGKNTDYSELQVQMFYNFVFPMVIHGTIANAMMQMDYVVKQCNSICRAMSS